MKKVSLHFGLNKFSSFYGATPSLKGCVNDSIFMEEICKKNGFKTERYNDKSCTKALFKSKLQELSKTLVAGDMFCFSISSHGTYLDQGGKRLTGLCMFDKIQWDHETKALLAEFKPGVIIIWFSDTCFAEDNFRFIERPDGTVKFIDSENLLKKENLTVRYVKSKDIVANMITYSSSNMWQPSYDLGKYGLFTKSLMESLKTPGLNYYKQFLKVSEVVAKTGYPQTPIFAVVNGDKEATTYRKFLN